MKSDNRRKQYRPKVFFLAIAILAISLVVGFPFKRIIATVGAQQQLPPNIPTPAPGSVYRQTNFISDIAGFAFVQDPLLVNPWGITTRGTSPFWVANNGTNTTQLIRGDVSGSPVVLNASPQTITIPGGLPTGAVSNSTSDFVVTPPVGSPAPALFIFDSITGNINA